MISNIRILAAMVYGAVVVVTALISKSNTGIVAIVGAIVLGAVYVVTRNRSSAGSP